MAYAQDTIISANAADALVTVIDGLLSDAGWSVVESLTPSSTFRAKVWKSAAADNEAGYDWYFAAIWNSVGTEQCVQFLGGAAYDDVAHKISQVPVGLAAAGSSGGYAEPGTGDMFGPVSINVNADLSSTMLAHGNAAQKTWFNVVVPSSAFAYWASVTLDHVSLFTTIAATSGYASFHHVGSLAVDPDYVALGYVATNPLYSYNQFGFGISACLIGDPTQTLSPSAFPSNSIGTYLPVLSDDYQPAYGWREAMYLGPVAAHAPVTGWSGGSFKEGVYIGSGIDTYRVLGGSIGDTVEIDGATYVICPMGTAVLSAVDVPTLAMLVE